MPGPHDFAVRSPPSKNASPDRCTPSEVFAKPDLAPFVLRAGIAHGVEAALRSPSAPDAAASTASHPNVRDDTQRPSLGDETAAFVALIWGYLKQKCFCKAG